jgi:uncharacterized protein YuzE
VQLSYDPRRNIAYLRVREATGTQVETVRLSDEVNVDLSPDGTLYGIELLNANAQLRASDGGRFVLVDEVAGSRIEVPLPDVA